MKHQTGSPFTVHGFRGSAQGMTTVVSFVNQVNRELTRNKTVAAIIAANPERPRRQNPLIHQSK
jgi:hypothetical protein